MLMAADSGQVSALCLLDLSAAFDLSTTTCHGFADDTQLYVHCHRDEVTSAVLRLENCIEEVSDWMSANRLMLNVDKTKLLWAGSRHGPAMLGSAGPSLQLRTETVVASDPTGVS